MSAIPSSIPLRNDLLGEEPYGAPQLDVPVCLNVNENPYPLEPDVVSSIAQRVASIAAELNRYPDREHIELRQAFSDYLAKESGTRLRVEQLWGANGSNEIMLQLFQAFGGPGRTALGCDPTYSMYPEYARDTFTTWKLAHRHEDFTLDVDRTIDAINEYGPSMVLVTSPNNPTGTVLPHDEIEALLAACEQAPVTGAPEGAHPILIVDEAYVEFRDPGTPSAVSLVPKHHNLAVSRTMSKAFAFAGARVGYLAADEGIIDAVRIVRMPYHLSAVTQAAALAAFEHTDEQLSTVAHLRQTREQTASWLAQQHYHGENIRVAPSGSNFVLFGTFERRETIFQDLLDRGVLIRVVGPEGWLRVCMGTDEEMARFRQAFTEVLALHDQA
ncbi:histidinol-phosphate transaminase [Bifidobacterium psychraerophilum]|uniref:Histidinol-phosphate aminotransferase n=2 Tax=Bifidobacterium psychraerophilum TaxID=218140 RepID=A0A087CE55_9BIFI|nr:histidinol-phosphate transaminase [Bifidobacterium psychraerophilum]KFI81555.1 histidinol-phosphate transaminase [Bifidobacterium psychraerophilum]PKA95899.1 histidinol phosphate aminotransferase [Bifidobacterium psychraerophilum DSM 22366]